MTVRSSRGVRASATAAVLGLLGAAVTVVVAAPAAAADCTVADPIARHYCELGGAASVLGGPVGAPYAVGGGRAQDYVTGTISGARGDLGHLDSPRP